MVRRGKNRAGYTLTEMILVVAIIGIVAMVAPTLITQLVRFYQLHNAKVEIQRDARACLDIMNRYIRQAESYSVVVDQLSGQPPYSRLSFSTISGGNIIFYQQGTNLYQVYRSTTVLSQNLHYIAFTYPRSDDPTILSVAMTMEKSTFQGAYKSLELSIEKVRIMN
jgi:prepilin-type N-terminal cleavage/methylation domain-containing protein